MGQAGQTNATRPNVTPTGFRVPLPYPNLRNSLSIHIARTEPREPTAVEFFRALGLVPHTPQNSPHDSRNCTHQRLGPQR